MRYGGSEEKTPNLLTRASVYHNGKLCETIVTFIAVKGVLINEYNKLKAFDVCKQRLLLLLGCGKVIL